MRRLAIISIDGVNWNIVKPMLEAGKLPHLQNMMKKGFHSTFQTHSFVSSGSTWPSIHTGRHPGDHGIFYSHRQMKSGTYHVFKKRAQDIPFKAFWQKTSENGIPTIAFDLPKAPYISDFNGLVLNSWGEEAPWYSPSYPRNLKKEVHAKFGKHPLQEFYHRPMKTKEAWLKIKNQLIECVKTRFQIAHWLMDKRNDWQHFIMAINELHLGGHLFWHLLDETHPDYDVDINKAVGDVMECMMIETDLGLKRLQERFPEAAFMIISNNGMGPSYQPVNIMDSILKKLGYMKGPVVEKHKVDRRSHNFVQEVEKILPLAWVPTLKKLIPLRIWYTLTRRFTHSAKDWKVSRAFPLPNDVSGAIRINLKGREPNGIVKPSEYESLCNRIIEDIMDLKIAGTGEPAVKRVIRVRKELAGEHMDEIADLLVLWNVNRPIEAIESEKTGKLYLKKDKRSGAHMDKGIFIWHKVSDELSEHSKELVHDLSIYPTVHDYFEIENNETDHPGILSELVSEST